ncbi:MAG: TetR/AcrR family transcriptional regulator [Actinobacteria bacterium]|nr:TetR/AcrR family transcriptional regulator [Actinomycetota bacterium]
MATSSHTSAGRPRSTEADDAIYDATIEILIEKGFGGISFEAVAATAGVAKTTIYRRHKTKEDLVVAALRCRLHGPTIETTGDFKDDLARLMSVIRTNMVDNNGIRMVSALMVEMDRAPLLLETFREKGHEERREHFMRFVTTAIDAGIVKPDVDPEIVCDMAVGALLAQTMAAGYPDPAYVTQLVDQVWSLIAVDPSVTTGAS